MWQVLEGEGDWGRSGACLSARAVHRGGGGGGGEVAPAASPFLVRISRLFSIVKVAIGQN